MMKSWLWVGMIWCTSVAAAATPAAPLIGIDHMPLAVNKLDEATNDYRHLGFAIKPGRPHTNGISTNNVKFPDGAGIELITAAEPRDDMTRNYLKLLAQGDAPAYIAFHARDMKKFVAAMKAAGLEYSQENGQLTGVSYQYIFFVGDNRSPTDRPEHFRHPNTATAMTGVWLAPADPAPLIRLFAALGAVAHKEVVLAPSPIHATVINVENGRVVLLPRSQQILKGRPIVGAEFDVAKGRPEVFLPPEQTHGLWLHFIPR
jgi:hypothetical protein